MKFTAIGDDLTVRALRLAGIKGHVVSEAEDAARALEEALDQDAIILISRAAAEKIPERIQRARAQRREAIVLELPDLRGAPDEVLSAQKLVAQAIGIKF